MRSKFKEIKRRYTLINLRVSKALVGEFVKKNPLYSLSLRPMAVHSW